MKPFQHVKPTQTQYPTKHKLNSAQPMTKPVTYRNQSKANLQNLKTSRNEIKNISPQLINSLSSIHFPDETIDTAMKPMAAAKLSQERYSNFLARFNSIECQFKHTLVTFISNKIVKI